MKALAALLLLLQAPALEVDATFEGTPAEALAAVARLAAEEPERAAALAASFAEDPLRPEPLRAEFRYAEGLALAGAGGDERAAQAFASARALSGPGELRTAAAYNQGTVELRMAEALRLATFQRLQDPAAAGAAPAASGGDPLRPVRDAYLRAKATLLERLRADFSGADARANLELVQRRLRELDELERQAEEEQQQQQPSEEGEPGEEGEEGEPREPGEEGEQEPAEASGDGQDQGAEQPPSQDPAASDPSAADPLDDLKPAGELPEAQPGEAQAGAPEERVLSREEVLRLLDRLDALEEEAQTLEALLRASRRIPVDKDW